MLSLITQTPTQFNKVRDGEMEWKRKRQKHGACSRARVCVAVWASVFPTRPRAAAEACNKAAHNELDKCQWAIDLGTEKPSRPHYI